MRYKKKLNKIAFVGGIAGQTDQLIAFALKEDEKGNEIEHELGVLNLVSYAKVRNKVVLVPVNGAPVPANVKHEINAVFAQSVAEWDVVIDAAYTVDASVLAALDEGESGMLASFPKNMRDFIQTFKQARDEDKNAYYLFIIPGNQSKRAGFMPFKRQFGFIYPENTNNTARTIAHELAHGAFRLRHTFSPEQFITSQGRTNNLMDYPAGPELRKYQWDNVHEPESMSGWFEDDAEVAMDGTREYLANLPVDERPINSEVLDGIGTTYVTPSGMPFTLPENAIPYFVAKFKDVKGDEYNPGVPNGALLGFKISGQTFLAKITCKGAQCEFKGYKLEGSADIFEEIDTEDKNSHDVVLGVIGKDCSLYLVSGKYNYATTAGAKFRGAGSLAPVINVAVVSETHSGRKPLDGCNLDQTAEPPVANFDLEPQFAGACTPEMEAALLAAFADHPWMEDGSPFKELILKNPCVLRGTYSTGEGLGYESPWMNDFNRTFGTMVNLALFPAVMEVMGPILLEQYGAQKVRDFAIGMSIDAAMQLAILTAFDGVSIDQAWEKVDKYAMLASGAEALVDNVYASMAASCLLDGIAENGEIDAELSLAKFTRECSEGALTALIVQKALKSGGKIFGRLKNLASANPTAFGFGLARLGFVETSQVKTVCEYLGIDANTIDKILPACFVAGTPVVMSDGSLKSVENVLTGDLVSSFDIGTGKVVTGRVAQTFKKQALQLIGVIAGGDTIFTTAEHPFYVEHTWVAAAQLQAGMQLHLRDNTSLSVDHIFIKDTTVAVYNFEVEEFNSYFVQRQGILVHNNCQILSDDLLNVLKNLDAATQQKVAGLGDKASEFLADVKRNSAIGGLVDVWASVKHVSDATRKNVSFLENLAFLKGVDGKGVRDHIFIGDLRKVTGVHYYRSVDNVNVKFAERVTPEGNSLGVIKGDIEMRKEVFDPNNGGRPYDPPQYKWVKKPTGGEPQTFFPSNWSQDEILEQCASAFSNPKKTLATKPDGVSQYSRMYVAESESGVFIRWFVDSNGNPTSFFPEF